MRGKAQETAADGGKGRCRGAPKDGARREAQCAHRLVVADGEQRERTEARILTAQEVGGMQLCTEMPKVKVSQKLGLGSAHPQLMASDKQKG